MCNIWQESSPNVDALNARLIAETISNSHILQRMPIVSFTGGEPFLRTDISEIMREIFNKTNIKKIVIATNGVLTNKIIKDLTEVLNKDSSVDKRIHIQISLDGIGDVHDRIRGVKGTFERVNSTIKKLKDLKAIYKNSLTIGILGIYQFENKNDFKSLYQYASDNNIDFGYGIIINTEYNKVETSEYNRDLLKTAIARTGLNGLEKNIKETLEGWLTAEQKIEKMQCFAGYNSVFWETNGDIYPCHNSSHLSSFKMGNILENDFDTIWKSRNANLVRQKVKNCTIKGDCMLGGCNISSQKVQYCIPHYLLKFLTAGRFDLYKHLGYY
jgi:radical SAM protein with 4Fe4S-binding SPASM domain